MRLSGKARQNNSWKQGEFIVEVSLPGPTHTQPGHPLIQCEAPATRLNGWSREVGVGQPKPFVNTSPAEILTALNERGEVDLLQPWSDFDPNQLVGTSIF